MWSSTYMSLVCLDGMVSVLSLLFYCFYHTTAYIVRYVLCKYWHKSRFRLDMSSMSYSYYWVVLSIHFYIKWCKTSQYHMQIHDAFPDDEGCRQLLCKVIIGIFRNRWDQLAPQWVGAIPKNNIIHSRLLVLQFSQKLSGTSHFHSFPPSHDVTSFCQLCLFAKTSFLSSKWPDHILISFSLKPSLICYHYPTDNNHLNMSSMTLLWWKFTTKCRVYVTNTFVK
jgi:hypothetical protein